MRSVKENLPLTFMKIFTYVILLFVLMLLQNCSSANSENEMVQKIEEQRKQEAVGIKTAGLSTSQIADSIHLKLNRKAMGFTSDLVLMSEEMVFSDATAEIKRQFEWDLAFPVTIRTSDPKVFPKEGNDKIVIEVSRLTVGKRYSYGNKRASTLEQKDWENEESKDSIFWDKVETLSKSKLKEGLEKDKALINKLKNKAASVIISKINKLLDGTGAEENEFEIMIDKIHLK
ncbi:MAG: hypothetical protein AB8F74_03760 [Saprospiraceae bacterium]